MKTLIGCAILLLVVLWIWNTHPGFLAGLQGPQTNYQTSYGQYPNGQYPQNGQYSPEQAYGSPALYPQNGQYGLPAQYSPVAVYPPNGLYSQNGVYPPFGYCQPVLQPYAAPVVCPQPVVQDYHPWYVPLCAPRREVVQTPGYFRSYSR